jgi:hypothetical protein
MVVVVVVEAIGVVVVVVVVIVSSSWYGDCISGSVKPSHGEFIHTLCTKKQDMC